MTLTPEDLEAQHRAILESMTPDQMLVMAREMVASRARLESERVGQFVSRKESLDAVFAAEAAARDLGAEPKIDFFLPLDNDFPEARLP
ncbi:hypothetical protein DOMOVOI_03490 [Brevundimonas phage vB_BpoS-Domovoi]|uniref:Uncharacterized protein n=1 Tax=Brevundimonas phage vB_BpoS-Domovoi TaxID=2948598 RepID=A0A9E7MQK7_9CAUD|nr:hypothetical protein DOMOVOI_03490 [Brevundimonas phage vB_BpoS-Domovoi]